METLNGRYGVQLMTSTYIGLYSAKYKECFHPLILLSVHCFCDDLHIEVSLNSRRAILGITNADGNSSPVHIRTRGGNR